MRKVLGAVGIALACAGGGVTARFWSDSQPPEPMNAFVHCGLHPLARNKDGFPEALAMSVVKISNALIHFAARLLSRFTGDREVMRQVDEAYKQFQDVMPMIATPKGET